MLLSVQNLTTHFLLDEGVIRAVDGVSFDLEEGETVGLVGESGCGKTIVAHSILGLMRWPGRILGGEVRFMGEDLVSATRERLRQVRGGGIGLVFQEPGASLNPVFTIGRQLVEVLRAHRSLSRADAVREAVRLIGDVGIAEPERRITAYPFELSGGMQQRVAIALAIAGRPRLLIADEPTTALDVTVQAEILDLLRQVQVEYGMAILIISHNIGVIAEIAERVLVMYTGKLVEEAATRELFRNPRHPYTRGLLAAAPRLGHAHDQPLRGIPGTVPDLMALPGGCTFHPRCPLVQTECRELFPSLVQIDDQHRVACYRATSSGNIEPIR